MWVSLESSFLVVFELCGFRYVSSLSLKNFSAIIPLIRLSFPFSLLLLFLFAPLIGWIELSYLEICWPFLLLDLVCCCTHVLNFSMQLLYSSTLWISFWFFKILFISVLKFSCCCMHYSPDIDEHLYDHYFEISIR